MIPFPIDTRDKAYRWIYTRMFASIDVALALEVVKIKIRKVILVVRGN